MKQYLKNAISAMVLFMSAGLAIAQSTSSETPSVRPSNWKEYVYADTGFAITSPKAPTIQRLDKSTTYFIVSRKDEFVNLSVRSFSEPCSKWDDWITKYEKETDEDIRAGIPWRSIGGVVTIDGHLAVVTEHVRKDIPAVDYERQQCFNNRIYSMKVRWPGKGSRPKDLGRVLDSFHLVAHPAKQ